MRWLNTKGFLILENILTIKIVNTVQCVSSSAKKLMNYNCLDNKIWKKNRKGKVIKIQAWGLELKFFYLERQVSDCHMWVSSTYYLLPLRRPRLKAELTKRLFGSGGGWVGLAEATEARLDQMTETCQKSDWKIREIDWSYLCLQQFDGILNIEVNK